MKKICVLACAVSLCFAGAAGAGTLRVGATPTPHAEILAQVRDDLKAQGVDLQVVEFTDYVTPNLALNDGELEANYFQHLPYLQSFCKDRGLDLTSAATIHVEPMGLFSKKFATFEELKNGALIAIPNDPTNCGRALLLLQSAGLIKLASDSGLTATELDIEENKHDFKFRSLEAAQLPRSLDDVDAAVINGNYAIPAGFNPAKDALLVEGADSPYANVIAVKAGNENNADVQALVKALQSDKVSKYILDTYAGGVLPAFGGPAK
ncbi:NLPA lipoprotein [Pyramidobacter piscolens W5455]|uniref:NLPA lipoprotein n=1 Tax=Pyramidobacter piscolens W5455 TaxID=352165 RepID=A0ABM9ZX29_9BACT|nr:MetQ/NlpA family ABC transporter substrate-binding protein [Pyramidobacter piscolens]EFB91501.1 NLPA lipoprotein [Pyramidobacter piscolens W5455]